MPRQSRIADILMAGSKQQAQMMNQAYGGLAQGMQGLFTGVGQGLESRRKRQEAEALKQRQAQMASLEAAGVAAEEAAQAQREELILRRAIEVATATNDTAALQALQVKALDPREYLSSLATKNEKTFNVPAGGAIVSSTGEVLYERDFRPEASGIETLKRDDGSVDIVDDTSGELISTLPPTGKGEQAKQDASLRLIAQTTSFIKDVEDLMGPSGWESGLVGGVMQGIPGTDAYDREKELLSIRARLGFEQINEMKRLAAESGASGTGLGQISNIEFMSLQSSVDAIYTGMSAEAQDKALRAIKQHLTALQKLASGVAPADAIDWSKPEYKAVGYHKDPETGSVFYAPEGPNGTVYKLVDGKFVKLRAYLGSTRVE